MTYEEERNYPERKIPMELDEDIPHYHGHTVRQVFFACGIIMLLCLTFFYSDIRIGSFLPLLGILAIAIFAGFTNPRMRSSIMVDVLISLCGLAYFELVAIFRYQALQTVLDGYFVSSQLLAVLFFIALYYSAKTFRGLSVK